MIIACAPDRRFCELAGVMLASLFANGDIGDARIMIFGLGLRPGEKRKLRDSCGSEGHRLEFVDVDRSDPTLQWLVSFFRVPNPASCVRLLIPTLLANERDRILYVDCDMLVVTSLRPLLELDLEGCVAAAVPDTEPTHPRNDPRPDRVAFPPDAPYFNAGLLVVDLAKWNEKNLSKTVFDIFERERDRLKWLDQDALNIALIGQWKPLALEWNVHRARAETLGGLETAKIIHFTGAAKPWSHECDHPQREVYLSYRRHTPWGRRRLETRFERRWAKILGKRRKMLTQLWKRLSGRSEPPAPQRPQATYSKTTASTMGIEH